MANHSLLDEEDNLVQLQKRARRRLVGAIVLVLFAIIVLWNVLDSKPPQALVNNEQIQVTNHASGINHAPLVEAPFIADAASQPTSLLPHHEASAPIASMVESVPQPSLPLESEALPGTHVLSSQELGRNEASASINRTNQTLQNKKPQDKKPLEKKPKPSVKEKASVKDPRRILEGLDEPSVARDTVSTKYILQVAAYKDAEKAQSVVKHLKSIGVRVNSEKVATSKGELTRVRVGPYASRKDADAALKKMRVHGISATVVEK